MNISTWVYAKLELAAFITGGVVGFVKVDPGYDLTDVAIKCVAAFLTASAATIGAHVTKQLITKLNKRKTNGRQVKS